MYRPIYRRHRCLPPLLLVDATSCTETIASTDREFITASPVSEPGPMSKKKVFKNSPPPSRPLDDMVDRHVDAVVARFESALHDRTAAEAPVEVPGVTQGDGGKARAASAPKAMSLTPAQLKKKFGPFLKVALELALLLAEKTPEDLDKAEAPDNFVPDVMFESLERLARRMQDGGGPPHEAGQTAPIPGSVTRTAPGVTAKPA